MALTFLKVNASVILRLLEKAETYTLVPWDELSLKGTGG